MITAAFSRRWRVQAHGSCSVPADVVVVNKPIRCCTLRRCLSTLHLVLTTAEWLSRAILSRSVVVFLILLILLFDSGRSIISWPVCSSQPGLYFSSFISRCLSHESLLVPVRNKEKKKGRQIQEEKDDDDLNKFDFWCLHSDPASFL